MSDLINRQDAIDAVLNGLLAWSHMPMWREQKILDMVKKVPPAQQWIPVSERLPKERVAVLVWCPERKNIYCACYEEKQWWIFGAYFNKIEFDVVAWMPLPKPWEGETNG